MAKPSASVTALIVLVLLVAFAVIGSSVGFIQTLIVVALVASAAMLTGLIAVSLTRQGY